METIAPTSPRPPAIGPQKLRGGCHCGAVRFEVEVDLRQPASRCNCSICVKVNPTAACVKPAAFTLLTPDADMGEYEWGFKVSRRYFCRTCGVFVFSRGHLAELGGDFVGCNLNFLYDVDPNDLKVIHWDGRHDNWDAGPRDRPWPIAAAAERTAAG